MSKKPDWMLRCDEPGCKVKYRADTPAKEALRGLDDFGVAVARRMAEEDGWFYIDLLDLDYCPSHAPNAPSVLASTSSGGES